MAYRIHQSSVIWWLSITTRLSINIMVFGFNVCPSIAVLRYLAGNFTPFDIQYFPRKMHTVFALLCFVVVIRWLIFPYPSGLLHWHCGNLTIAPVPAKQPWWIWINTSCEFIMNDCITTTKQSTTKPCEFFLGYTVCTKPYGCLPLANEEGFGSFRSICRLHFTYFAFKWWVLITEISHMGFSTQLHVP